MTKRYFLTLDWCREGQRGIFCNKEGVSFHKDDEPHTQEEINQILGLFWIILAPKSEPFTEEQIAEFTYFRPLAEYTNQYGIAYKAEDVPIKEQSED